MFCTKSLLNLLQSSGVAIADSIFRMLLPTHVTPLLFSPPIGHSYFAVVVDDDVVGVVLVDVEAGVVGGGVVLGGGGGGQQASETEMTREIARTEQKKFIFVSVLVTRLKG